jgi:hypothetical protein
MDRVERLLLDAYRGRGCVATASIDEQPPDRPTEAIGFVETPGVCGRGPWPLRSRECASASSAPICLKAEGGMRCAQPNGTAAPTSVGAIGSVAKHARRWERRPRSDMGETGSATRDDYGRIGPILLSPIQSRAAEHQRLASVCSRRCRTSSGWSIFGIDVGRSPSSAKASDIPSGKATRWCLGPRRVLLGAPRDKLYGRCHPAICARLSASCRTGWDEGDPAYFRRRGRFR